MNNNPESCKTDVLGNFRMLATQTNCSKIWKRRVLKNPGDLSNEILKILDMRSISVKKHEMEIWQYGIIESLKL